MEAALRNEIPDVAIPYWDSTLDHGLPDPRDSILWTEAYFGNGNGFVTNGPFANWATDTPLPEQPNSKRLFRYLLFFLRFLKNLKKMQNVPKINIPKISEKSAHPLSAVSFAPLTSTGSPTVKLSPN